MRYSQSQKIEKPHNVLLLNVMCDYYFSYIKAKNKLQTRDKGGDSEVRFVDGCFDCRKERGR